MNTTITQCRVPYGVPRGSVLGPLLFILYIADAATIPDKNMDYLLTFMPTTFSCICLVVVVTQLDVSAESLLVLMTSPNGWPQIV